MTLWTRLGFLIPVFWVLGFVAIYFLDKLGSGFIPEKWLFTMGHLVGTIFVWIFSMSFGYTKIKEVMDVETGEKSIIERPHKFLMFSATTWGLLLTIAVGWFLYRPPPKSWLDQAFLQKDALEKKIKDAVPVVRESVTGEAMMRDWTNKEGKTVRAKYLRVELKEGAKHVVFVREKDSKEFSVRLDLLSAEDQKYVNDHESR